MTKQYRAALIILLLSASSTCINAAGAAERTEQEWLNSIKQVEKQYGTSDTRVAELRFAFGKSFHSRKQYDKAQSELNKAMSTFQKSPGTNGDLLRYYSDELARIDLEEGKLAESEALFKRSLAIGEKLPGKDKTYVIPNTLQGLAELYVAQGKYDLAEPLLKRRIEMRHRFMNAGQVDVALLDLANLYTRWGKFEKSKELFDQLMTIQPRPPKVKAGWTELQSKLSSAASVESNTTTNTPSNASSVN